MDRVRCERRNTYASSINESNPRVSRTHRSLPYPAQLIPPRSGYTHLQDFDTLANRVKELELMLLTLVNDNAGVLNLSRVQPYLDGADDGADEQPRDQSMDGQDQAFTDDPPLVQIDEPAVLPPSEGRRTAPGVRFEETFANPMGGNGEPWFGGGAGQVQGGMRLSDIVNIGSTTNVSAAGSGTTRLEAPVAAEQQGHKAPVSIAAQQLLDFGSGYAAHQPWTTDGAQPQQPPAPAEPKALAVPTKDEPAHATSDASTRARRFAAGLRDRDTDREWLDYSRTHSRAPSLTEHHAALALEDMALNRNVARGNSVVIGGGGGGGAGAGESGDLLPGVGVGGGAPGAGDGAGREWTGMLDNPTMTAGGVIMPGTQPSWARRVHVSGLDALPPIGQAQPIITYFVSHRVGGIRSRRVS